MLPPIVTGFAALPTGADGSLGASGEAGTMSVCGGTAPVGCPAFGSAPAGGAGGDGVAEGVAASSGGGMSCAIAMPLRPATDSIAAPASINDFIGTSFPQVFARFA
ncbi:MAG: hypothetical protein AB7E60_09360 [Sphingobium sp.]